MVLGKELIVEVEYVEDYSVLETIDGIKSLMENKLQNCNLNDVGKCEYQFWPVGATMLYLLSESHLTIHNTYVSSKKGL